MALFAPIHHFFGPQADWRQWCRAAGMLLAVHRYKRGESVAVLEREMTEAFGAPARLFCTGTDALVAVLHAVGLKPCDEVIVPGYTCFSPGGAVSAVGATPVYVDVSPDTLDLTVASVKAAMTPRTRAIIAQHTLGIPAPMEALREICDREGIVLVEDCAHMIPDSIGPRKMGNHGHATIFSFGRYKAISGMAGGAAVCNDPALDKRVSELQRNAPSISRSVIARLLLYPLVFPLLRPLIGIGVGTLLLWLCKEWNILLKGSTPDELRWQVGPTAYRIPNACAFLALQQWRRLSAFNAHRRALTRFYLAAAREHGWFFPSAITEDLPLQKFPIFLRGAERIRLALKRKNIHLYDGCWSRAALTDAGVVVNEYLHPDMWKTAPGRQALMLPIHPTMSLRQARRLVWEIARCASQTRPDDAVYRAPVYPRVNAYGV